VAFLNIVATISIRRLWPGNKRRKICYRETITTLHEAHPFQAGCKFEGQVRLPAPSWSVRPCVYPALVAIYTLAKPWFSLSDLFLANGTPMDAAHSSSLNSRKRKADADDCTDSASTDTLSSEPILVENSVPTCTSSNAPRQPPSTSWMPSGANREMWPTTSSPIAKTSSDVLTIPHAPPKTPLAKRPRIETSQTSPHCLPTCSTPTSRSPTSPHRMPGRRTRRDDTVDMGVVSTRPPGPSQGSLLRLREPKPPKRSLAHPLPIAAPPVPIDPNSPHIPSLQPLINRQTLKELDLDAILRNPQLRT
jgi:hypothetical protein